MATRMHAPGEKRTVFIIELEYIGPDRESKGRHAHKLRIQSEPGRKNMSGETCTDGYLGTTDDWYKAAWGEFEPDDARAFILYHFHVEVDRVRSGDEIYLTP